MGIEKTCYSIDMRWVLRLAFWFFIPSFFLIFFLWASMVLLDTFNRSAVSFVLFPCFIRFAIWISAGVRLKYLEDNRLEKGEIMSESDAEFGRRGHLWMGTSE